MADMMSKTGTENITCVYCTKKPLPGTNPPVCREHLNKAKDKDGPRTVKELENE